MKIAGLLRGILHRYACGGEFPAENRGENRLQIAVPGRQELRFALPDEAEFHLRIGEREPIHDLRNGGALRDILL